MIQFCAAHWEQLRAALTARSVLPTSATLAIAHNEIIDEAIKFEGDAVLNSNPDGSLRCPLCHCHAIGAAVLIERGIVRARNSFPRT